jgi:hypothetical protein
VPARGPPPSRHHDDGKGAGTTGQASAARASSPGRRTGAREPARKRALSRQLAVRFRWPATISGRSPTRTTASARCHRCPSSWPSASQRSLGAQLRTVPLPQPPACLVPRLRSRCPAASAGLDGCPATVLQPWHRDRLAWTSAATPLRSRACVVDRPRLPRCRRMGDRPPTRSPAVLAFSPRRRPYRDGKSLREMPACSCLTRKLVSLGQVPRRPA